MEIQSVGVVGAGQMGNGIAQVCAMAGLSVVLTDVSSKALEKAQATIANSLARLVKKGQLSDPDVVLSRIVFSNEMADLAAVDIAIEAATECLEIKIDILRQLSALVRPGDYCLEYFLHLAHRLSGTGQPAATRHWYALYESGAGDATG